MKNEELIEKRKYGGVEASLRVKERRSKLMEAGLEAFGTTGYQNSSIKLICNLAGLTERYFYESFQNKEELLACVYNDLVDDFIKKAINHLSDSSPNPLDLLTGAIRVTYGEFQTDPRKARILFFEVLGVSPEIDAFYRRAMRQLVDVVSLAVCSAFPRIDREALDKTMVPTGLAGALNLITHRWVLNDFDIPLEDMFAQMAVIIDPLSKILQINSD